MIADAIPLDRLRRALVIKLRHHGDVLLTAPVFSTLKRAAPQCEIDALVYADTLPMLTDHPAIAQLHGIGRDWKRRGLLGQAAAEWALLAQLRARGYDLIIHLTEHRRGAWMTRLLQPQWAVAPAVRGRGGLWQRSFTHFTAQPLNARRHTVERHLDALRRIGLQASAADKQVVLVPGRAAEERVAALMAQHGLGQGSYVHMHPTSRWLFKCWPAAKFAALANRLAEAGMKIVLTAAPDEKEKSFIRDMLPALGGATLDLSGQLSLKELAAIAARARLFVGVDSAPMHIAAAMGTPVIALFGPSGELEWGPWNVAHRVVCSDRHPCRPCGIDGCGGGKVSECLETLSVDSVHAACAELLAA